MPDDPRNDGRIEEVAAHSEHAPPDFLDGVRKKIDRRVLANEALAFSWRGVGLLLLHWMMMIADLLRGRPDDEGGRGDE